MTTEPDRRHRDPDGRRAPLPQRARWAAASGVALLVLAIASGAAIAYNDPPLNDTYDWPTSTTELSDPVARGGPLAPIFPTPTPDEPTPWDPGKGPLVVYGKALTRPPPVVAPRPVAAPATPTTIVAPAPAEPATDPPTEELAGLPSIDPEPVEQPPAEDPPTEPELKLPADPAADDGPPLLEEPAP